MKNQRLSFAYPAPRRGSDIVSNLLQDTDASVLAMLSTRHGLKRVPGLSQDALIDRMLRYLSDDTLKRLQNEMIAARYGELSVPKLLELAMDVSRRDEGLAKARLDHITEGEAILIETGDRRWVYTMHGHDVEIDLNQRTLACGCQYFAFASRREALCKHLALALRLIPPAYAREALTDLIVMRKYGGKRQSQWTFDSEAA